MSERSAEEAISSIYTSYLPLTKSPITASNPHRPANLTSPTTAQLPSRATTSTTRPILQGDEYRGRSTMEDGLVSERHAEKETGKDFKGFLRSAGGDTRRGKGRQMANIQGRKRNDHGRFASVDNTSGHLHPDHSIPPAFPQHLSQTGPSSGIEGAMKRKASDQSLSVTEGKLKKRKNLTTARMSTELGSTSHHTPLATVTADEEDAHALNIGDATKIASENSSDIVSMPSNPAFSPRPYLPPMVAQDTTTPLPRSLKNGLLFDNGALTTVAAGGSGTNAVGSELGIVSNSKVEHAGTRAGVPETFSEVRMPGRYPIPQAVRGEEGPSNDIDSSMSMINKKLELLLDGHQSLMGTTQTLEAKIERLGGQVEQLAELLRLAVKPNPAIP